MNDTKLIGRQARLRDEMGGYFDSNLGRVASGRCRPEAPTDPDVRISRIRFVRSRVR